MRATTRTAPCASSTRRATYRDVSRCAFVASARAFSGDTSVSPFIVVDPNQPHAVIVTGEFPDGTNAQDDYFLIGACP